MELVGEDKRIQALFSDLRLADERGTPEFAIVWQRAQTTGPELRHAFKLSFAAATALILITLCSLLLWSRNWRRAEQPNSIVRSTTPALLPAPPSVTLGPKQLATEDLSGNRIKPNDGARRLRRRADSLALRQTEFRNAVVISIWRSPTATLMQSPADDVLTSLPQLDRSVNELKSFLPDIQK
jgi:hypothetical protein